MSRLVLGISSGIAAYKMIDLVKILKTRNHSLSVILTSPAKNIISAKVLMQENVPVYTELFPQTFSPQDIVQKRKVEHIEVAQHADLFVIAPATANTIAKLAHGIADDFLTTAVLATTAPVLIFPSMNTVMWNHPATQKNIQTLESYGYLVVSPDSGPLACGTDGIGRLPSPDAIADEINVQLTHSTSLVGKKIIVTAGGTAEQIDAARILTNRSSGKMGIAIANECYRRGADILLVHAKTAVKTHFPIRSIPFTSAHDLQKILEKEVPKYDMIFHAAAVSDFTIESVDGKIDSTQPISLTLKPTEKIISKIKAWNPTIKLIGFKAMYGEADSENTAKEMLKATNADYIVVNDISREDIGFEADENEVSIFDQNLKQTLIAKTSKQQIARTILNSIYK